MTKLKSGVSRELDGHFVLDEDGSRRIVGVFEAKSKDLAHPTSIVFHVEREDDRFYETTKVDDVLADANTPGHRITYLGIELRNADPNKPPQPWERDWIAAVHFKTKGDKQSIVIGARGSKLGLITRGRTGATGSKNPYTIENTNAVACRSLRCDSHMASHPFEATTKISIVRHRSCH